MMNFQLKKIQFILSCFYTRHHAHNKFLSSQRTPFRCERANGAKKCVKVFRQKPAIAKSLDTLLVCTKARKVCYLEGELHSKKAGFFLFADKKTIQR